MQSDWHAGQALSRVPIMQQVNRIKIIPPPGPPVRRTGRGNLFDQREGQRAEPERTTRSVKRIRMEATSARVAEEAGRS